ncbi:hypothetical protein BXZ70DRAFT_958549 [Cristinia sonorae]|uniref:Peptidase C19 ubiquitin carboxyl-terminal hydrolase domain-containing protein n=1 Tax=Cristinia sonorae TaxID=1940300 RepID=A0A8K0UG05_9AGAR|nr:hypothetical protein BXZ70DRAFT_958549 [Cristinia sonorae]
MEQLFQRSVTFSPAPPTPQENSSVNTLMSMMGPNCHYDEALRVLRASGGDLEKAIGAMLEENAAADSIVPRTPPPSKPERGTPPIIDLTGDNDEDISRALAASLQDMESTLRPSDRAPDPNWAVVPSNVEVNANNASLTQGDQDLNRAIEASLNYHMEDSYDELPLEERVRVGDIPISLRPTQSSYVYAGLILQGLFFVPQVKQAIALYIPPRDTDDPAAPLTLIPPQSGPDHLLWTLLELFANMELARMTELNIDQALGAFECEQWKSPAESPGDIAYRFYNNLAFTVEAVLNRDEATTYPIASWPRLFHFRFGFNDTEDFKGPFDKRHDMSIVRIPLAGTPDANDLLSVLAFELAIGENESTKHQVIYEPSAVVAFQLDRTFVSSGSGGGKNERATFKYPPSVYLDQFLKKNAELAAEKRKLQRELVEEIEKLRKKRDTLTKHNDRDVLADLQSALHYYENIAEDGDDKDRKAAIHDAALRLRKILTKIENELQTIDVTISKHQTKVASVFDCPELQKHRYDLRFVIVHDGLYGRNHLYSYVNQRGQWWKTVDYHVTQVSEETVLNDAVGLHLNAGPFFLLYSRSISPEEESMQPAYPITVKDSVKHNNARLLASLSPHVQARAYDPNSPPSTPAFDFSEVPSLSSSIVEPPESPRTDYMDLD